MKTFKEALEEGFQSVYQAKDGKIVIDSENEVGMPDYYSFKFGDNEEYELNFEPLLFDNQYYVALYKNKELLTEKVVVKPVK